MQNKKKRNLNNRRVGSGLLGYMWQGIVVFGTLTGAIYSSEYLKDKFYKPKKRIFDFYDEDVINEVNELKKNSIQKGIDLDYDETLNKLQEIKNLGKIEKKDD